MILPVSTSNFYFKGTFGIPPETNQGYSDRAQILPAKQEESSQNNKKNIAKLLNICFTAAVISLFVLAAFLTPGACNGVKGKIKPPRK